MTLLHTADWHLGRTLYGRKRYDEHSAFLDWLVQTLESESVEVLLVAGDIFDTGTPGSRVQELYYRFLCRVAAGPCRHIVITAGNHDSPSFLDAPKQLLKTLDIHIVGRATNPIDGEVIILKTDDTPKAIVCAVPYLRDGDIRVSEPGETIDDKNARLVEGIKTHYAEVCSAACRRHDELTTAGHSGIPIVAMGHLFTAGGQTVEGDGVRELYVGSLAHVGTDVFPSAIDYLALGHLHVPQCVGGVGHMRYSGSPIAMGFNEAGQQKQVLLVEFSGRQPAVKPLPIPCFQSLVRVSGSMTDIQEEIRRLKESGSRAWLEIDYTGREIVGDLRERLDEAVGDSRMEIRRIGNRRVMKGITGMANEAETLDNLDVNDVFARCLDRSDVLDNERSKLIVSHNEIIQSLYDEDVNEDS